MLYSTALVLLVFWLLGFINSTAQGGSIHVLLAAAIVLFAVNAVRERRGERRAR